MCSATTRPSTASPRNSSRSLEGTPSCSPHQLRCESAWCEERRVGERVPQPFGELRRAPVVHVHARADQPASSLAYDVVDGVAHRAQVLEVLVIDAEAHRPLAQLLLQRLHQLDQGQGVGVEVLGEGGPLGDGRRGRSPRCRRAGPGSARTRPGGPAAARSMWVSAGTRAPGLLGVGSWSDVTVPGPPRRVDPQPGGAGRRALSRRPTAAARLARPARPAARSWATRTALTMAAREDEPWLMTHTPSTPSSMAPPVFSGSNSAAMGSRWGRSTSAAAWVASSVPKTSSEGLEQEAQRPLQGLEGHVAGEPVGHHDVGRAGQQVPALDVAGEAHPGRTGRQQGVGLLDERGALGRLLADREQGHRRVGDAVAGGGVGRAHLGELDQHGRRCTRRWPRRRPGRPGPRPGGAAAWRCTGAGPPGADPCAGGPRPWWPRCCRR